MVLPRRQRQPRQRPRPSNRLYMLLRSTVMSRLLKNHMHLGFSSLVYLSRHSDMTWVSRGQKPPPEAHLPLHVVALLVCKAEWSCFVTAHDERSIHHVSLPFLWKEFFCIAHIRFSWVLSCSIMGCIGRRNVNRGLLLHVFIFNRFKGVVGLVTMNAVGCWVLLGCCLERVDDISNETSLWIWYD